jgi:hypothetical protein
MWRLKRRPLNFWGAERPVEALASLADSTDGRAREVI